MFALRPIRLDDLDAYYDLASSAAEAITTLPKDKTLLQKNIHNSVLSFTGQEPKSAHTLFLFVLEDVKEGILVGASALKSDNAYTDAYTPFYLKGNASPPTSLDLFPSHTPFTELATLYLRESYRKLGLGKLLTKGRYLYISRFPEKFHEIFIARLRGYLRPEMIQPAFWEQMGQLFDRQPYYPIHVSKFSQEVQDNIGKVHPKTKPAYHMLEKEGFANHQVYDIYDTGPRLECKRDEIHSVKSSQELKVESIEDFNDHDARFVISSTNESFKATYGEIRLSQKKPHHAIISANVSKILSVSEGDTIRYVS